MATARSAIAPSYQAFEPSARTVGLDQIIAQNPALAGMGYASQVNDQNATQSYIDALRQAQQTQGSLQLSDLRMKALDALIPALAPATTAGVGDAPVTLASRIAGFDLGPMPASLLSASQLSRNDKAATAFKSLQEGGKSASDAGKMPLTPEGTYDLTNSDPLQDYTNPGDRARAIAASKPIVLGSVMQTVGDKTFTDKVTSAGGGTVDHSQATQPARGNPATGGVKLTPEQNTVVVNANKQAQAKGLQVAPAQDVKSGNLVLTFKDAKGATAGTLTYNAQGKLVQ